jgi:hypothetical protein
MFPLFVILLYVWKCECNPHLIKREHAYIVTVRYLDPLPSDLKHPLWFIKYPHLVVNRGEGKFPPNVNSIESLENVGREGFVYLNFLYHHYDNLPNITIFAQYDHLMGQGECPDIKSIMEGGALPKPSDGFAFVGNGCLDDRARVFLYGYEEWGESLGVVEEHFHKFLGPGFYVKNPRFVPTALFAVSRDAVRRNPKSLYLKLARLLGSTSNPYEGHFIERAWPEIFKSTCSAGELFCCRYAEPYCIKEEVLEPLSP